MTLTFIKIKFIICADSPIELLGYHEEYISDGVRFKDGCQKNGGCHGHAHFYRLTTSTFSCPEDHSRTPNGFPVLTFFGKPNP